MFNQFLKSTWFDFKPKYYIEKPTEYKYFLRILQINLMPDFAPPAKSVHKGVLNYVQSSQFSSSILKLFPLLQIYKFCIAIAGSAGLQKYISSWVKSTVENQKSKSGMQRLKIQGITIFLLIADNVYNTQGKKAIIPYSALQIHHSTVQCKTNIFYYRTNTKTNKIQR